MELLDGIIVGIYEYCDRWCERCTFTSRCRSFAEAARLEASRDPALQAVVYAPPRPEDVPPPLPAWAEKLLDEMDRATSQPVTREELEALRCGAPAGPQRIVECARDYAVRVSAGRTRAAGRGPSDPATRAP